MFKRLRTTRILIACLAFSIAGHALALCGVRMLGSYRFGAAVARAPFVMVSLADLQEIHPRQEESSHLPPVPQQKEAPSPAEPHQGQERGEGVEGSAVAESAEAGEGNGKEELVTEAEPEEVHPPVATAEESVGSPESPGGAGADHPEAPVTPAAVAATPAREEKLTYQISMLGVPVGRAELEAKNGGRGTTITLRVKSNSAISGIYPVDNVVETQHVDGRFLMTRIRQHEGAFRSDESFSINLQQKRVSWTDNINYRRLRMSLPTDEVLDTLSGIYSLRTRPLQVGKTETLHIFDSESYAEVPVEIVRREKMRLPNLAEVDALVVRPLQKTAGIFRRTGEILIWLTDDANKVPVKISTTITLGRVTAELVSAESRGDSGEGAAE